MTCERPSGSATRRYCRERTPGRNTPAGFVAGLEVSDEMLAMARTRLRRHIASGRLEVRLGSVESTVVGLVQIFRWAGRLFR